MNGAPPQSPAGEPNAPVPTVAGLKVRPELTIALFILLGISAALALWTQGNPGRSPVWLERGAPWLFLVFTIGFAAYRFALVAAGRYSAFKAFFQIFLAAIFFMMLLPGSPLTTRGASQAENVQLLGHPEARVRAQAAELAGWRHSLPEAPTLVRLLDDPDPQVKARAHDALVKINDGTDLGTDAAAWRQRFP